MNNSGTYIQSMYLSEQSVYCAGLQRVSVVKKNCKDQYYTDFYLLFSVSYFGDGGGKRGRRV